MEYERYDIISKHIYDLERNHCYGGKITSILSSKDYEKLINTVRNDTLEHLIKSQKMFNQLNNRVDISDECKFKKQHIDKMYSSIINNMADMISMYMVKIEKTECVVEENTNKFIENKQYLDMNMIGKIYTNEIINSQGELRIT